MTGGAQPLSIRASAPALPRRATMDLTDVRRHHLSLVLETLLHDGEQSRAQLAQQIGLTKATVSALVADLLDRGMVEEREVRRSGTVGRPGLDVAARSWSVGALGLEVDVDSVAACLVDLAGEIRVRERRVVRNVGAAPARVFARLADLANAVLRDSAARDVRCVGAAVAVPGLVDPSTREVLVAPNLGWRDVAIPERLAGTDLLLDVDNEANLAAQGELRHGVARDLQSFVYVSGGVGVGGAVVVDGELVRGAHGVAGELGHVMVDPRGPVCACGARGCLEVYVGAGHSVKPKRAVEALATALRPVVHLVDPQAVILGGALADSPAIADGLALALNARTLAGARRPVEIRRSALGADAAAVGGASRALDRVLADPTLVPELAESQPA